MAKRPVYLPVSNKSHLVDEMQCDFEWNPGFSPTQKKKNVMALHASAKRKSLFPILEVSTKSEEKLGQRLSAFNLKIATPEGDISIESAYQGSKVFEHGGPYIDLYTKDSRTAKKDSRLKTSGKLVGFNFFGSNWPLSPKTSFYDWLYLSALQPYQDFLIRHLYQYKGFTDIEFNPKKSVNCQARSCAILVSLLKLNELDNALASQESFIKMTMQDSLEESSPYNCKQTTLNLGIKN
ncbi:DUF6977 family protein [Picosynechococcus sp. PCC 7117]|uniref:DarT1-associated NADAR antitoxin family protein n=1 Tax=Picosynechococcus sp. PCC 7117 TaxID=195498 RepID=UPI0008106AC2|nr:hypothetical protein [Picosynechococcus sp. PCC 7117]ANV86913.1 hypothetical protein AWQ22_05205 [Picosynechococcus sp. PCC 7117]